MNKYLQRVYFGEDVNSFYKKGIFLRCTEQIKYELLRDYDVNYSLILCDDINMVYSNYNNQENVFSYELGINNRMFQYTPFMYKMDSIISKIDQALMDYQMVVVKTAFNKIRMFKWYGGNLDDAEMSQHNTILIGMDNDHYFILDSPHVRNTKFFIAHPQNKQIGIVSKGEVYDALRERCVAGIMSIKEEEVYTYPTIENIIDHIVVNYYDQSIKKYQDKYPYCIGRKAIMMLCDSIDMRRDIRNFYTLPYICETFISRYKRLKYCLMEISDDDNLFKTIDSIISVWNVIKLLIMKQRCVKKDDVYCSLSNRLKELLDKNDKLMGLLTMIGGKSYDKSS